MWCTSRASPVSTMRPTWVRVFSRMRWWCTALGEQQRRDRRQLGVRVAVGEDDQLGAVARWRPTPWPGSPRAPGAALAALGHRVEAVDGEGLEAGEVAVVVDVEELGQLVVREDRRRHDDLPARCRRRVEQVALGAERRRQARHQLLADGVEGRVRHLGEELLRSSRTAGAASRESTATGVSVPIEPIGSAPVRAIGARRTFCSSIV